jgi:hypothetical protein
MSLKKIIAEEVERQSKKYNLKPDELKTFMTELFSFNPSKLLTSLGNQGEILDEKDALPDEFWQELIDTINDSYGELEDDWEKELKGVKFTILCYKYFTKQDLPNLDDVEKELKVEIKKYFSSLQNYTSLENFKDRFFNLPSKILFNFVRYILNKSLELNAKLKISKLEFKEKITKLKEDREKIINKISFVSNRNVSILDLKQIKELVDNGLFYEDNLLNRGVNEYLYKMLTHKDAAKNIIDTFNSTFLHDLTASVETSNSYLSHISSVKNEESGEYFSPPGIQIGRRFDNEIESVKSKDYDDAVIDKDSIFKEPKGRIQSADFSWGDASGAATGEDGEDAGGDMGSGSGLGGSGGGGGGGSFNGPTGGDETVDIDTGGEGGGEEGTSDEGEAMPSGEDGLPTDFGTEESNDEGGSEETKPEEEK